MKFLAEAIHDKLQNFHEIFNDAQQYEKNDFLNFLLIDVKQICTKTTKSKKMTKRPLNLCRERILCNRFYSVSDCFFFAWCKMRRPATQFDASRLCCFFAVRPNTGTMNLRF